MGMLVLGASLQKNPSDRGALYAAFPERGFTLVELIVTMVIVGILAAVMAPRFTNRQDYDQRGAYDGTLTILRYAQKSAVAQRRNVCVTFSAAGVVPATVGLQIRSAFSSDCLAVCDTDLAGPDGGAHYVLTVPVGVAFAAPLAYPASFNFCPSGAASVGQTFSVSGVAPTITVVATTGYVF